ncbi:MAG: nucleotidyltransferase family protein, partial [Clostridia bacterium]|nr:nucleotidyltransferase family protein [Clostridia bacterium]
IPFVPLKGAVIRKYYDEAWLRTSCDIDILIKENDLKKSVDALVGHLGYKTDGKREFHDISLFSESGVHLELHFNILSNLEAIDKLLGSVWEHTVLSERGSFEYCLDNEFFMFYLTAHMASHVLSGGCGIRSIMDMKIMRMNLKYDEQKVINSCKQCGIDRFYLSVKKLSDIWFSGVCHDENSVKMENYILNGGIYGVMKTGIAAKMETGGRLKYALHRIFQPYYVIKEKYPILKKYPVLTPFYEVRRWIDIVIRGRAKASIKELEINSKVTKEDVAKVKDMLSAFGL